MLSAPGLSGYNFLFDNYGANPAAAPGTTLTASATANTKGAFSQVAASTDLTRDIYWVKVLIYGLSANTQQRDCLLDIGIDEAGGTSYTVRIANLVCGEVFATDLSRGPATFMFPLFIKAGSSVACRIASNLGSQTAKVAIKFYGDPTNPEAVPVGQYSETLGTITNSGGTSFTPGTAADGTWTSLGTTVKDLWWWNIGAQVSSNTIGGEACYVDVGYGDGTNFTIIQRALMLTNSAEQVSYLSFGNLTLVDSYCYVPGGSTIYVRGRASVAPTVGWNATAIGIGG